MKRLLAALLGAVLFAPAGRAQEKPTQIVRDLSRPTAGSATVFYGNQSGDGQFGGGFTGGKGGGFTGGKAGGKGGGFGGGMGGGKPGPLTPECPVPWYVRSEQLQGGRQEGVHVIYLNNGKLTIAIVPTRGMGILDVSHTFVEVDEQKARRRIGWQSPVKEIVNPAFMNLGARGGLGWLEGFNEFMCRCGLENVGQPGKDEIVTNTGAKAEVDLTLHGKIANIPARQVELVVDPQPPYRIRMFGPKLDLFTEISTEPGSMEFRIEDKVVNAGSQPQEFQMVYHTNIGKPLLEDGARFLAPVTRVTPVNAHSAKDAKNLGEVAGPTPGIIEQAYFMHPIADKEGKAMALIHNKAQDYGMSMRWPVKQLPYLTLWKNTAAVEDGYVIGIEPGTSFPNMRKVERKAGRVPTLAGGASHTMTIDFGVHVGAAALEPVLNRIDAMQRGQKTVIDEAP
jgi:hypothetical protein